MKKTKKNHCDGCCYREWHNGDTTKCNYLSNNRCLINEYSSNYMFKEKRGQ